MDARRWVGSLTTGIVVVALLGVGCSTWRGAELYESGTAALERGDSERAIADLERAAEYVPDASEVHNHLGLAYGAAGRQDEMVAAFRYALELDCDNLSARHNLEVALKDSGAVVQQPIAPQPKQESPDGP